MDGKIALNGSSGAELVYTSETGRSPRLAGPHSLTVEGRYVHVPAEGSRPAYDLMIAEVYGDDVADGELMEAILNTSGSYFPTVSWSEVSDCYRIEAIWDPDKDWGYDFKLLERTLRRERPGSSVCVLMVELPQGVVASIENSS